MSMAITIKKPHLFLKGLFLCLIAIYYLLLFQEMKKNMSMAITIKKPHLSSKGLLLFYNAALNIEQNGLFGANARTCTFLEEE